MNALRITIAGQSVSLYPQRAAFWHDTSTLLVADMHLGRQQAWRAGGVPVSDAAQIASLDEPLARLSMLLEHTDAARLVVLGDLLHAPAGLTDAMIHRVALWRSTHAERQFEVIPGNHDRSLDRVVDAWQLAVREANLVVPPFEFVHDPADATAQTATVPLIACSGHVHPMVRLSARRESVRVPAFLLSPRLFLFPAFSGHFSGVTIDPAPDTTVFPIAGDRVLDLQPSNDAR